MQETTHAESNLSKGFTSNNGEKKEIPKLDYTDTEKASMSTIYDLLSRARSEREKPKEEFDDLSYSHHYDSNRRADLGYLPKKKNKEDSRVSTGLTHEKDNTLLTFLLKFDFIAFIQAYDQDNFLLSDMGSEFTDLVNKSREIEDYMDTRYYIYREYVSQGDVFVEEYLDFPIEMKKTESKEGEGALDWNPTMPIESFKQNVEQVKGLPVCRARNIPGKMVYLGDLRKEHIKDQPFIFTYEVISRKEAEMRYGKWSRWKYVPTQIETIEPVALGDLGRQNWGFTRTKEDEVGVLRFQRKGLNEYQLFLNGIPMLPLGYPLTKVSYSGEYTISQGKFEGITNFSYSKSQPSKTKFDEDTLNEFYKLMILKMKQSLKPPLGNKTGKTIDSSIFLPGNIINDVTPKQLFPLFTSQGPTSGEFSFFELVKRSIEDKSINKVFSGQNQEGDPTATQIIEEKKAQMLRLGLALDGIVNLERAMIWKRIYSVCAVYTDPVKKGNLKEGIKSVYRSFTYETDIDGEKGVKIFHFTEEEFPQERDQQALEHDLEGYYNKKVKIVLLDPTILKSFKAIWKVGVTPSERSDSDYESMRLSRQIQESYELFGPEAHNAEYLKQRYGNVNRIDSSKWFNQQMQGEQMMESIRTAQKSKKPSSVKGGEISK